MGNKYASGFELDSVLCVMHDFCLCNIQGQMQIIFCHVSYIQIVYSPIFFIFYRSL